MTQINGVRSLGVGELGFMEREGWVGGFSGSSLLPGKLEKSESLIRALVVKREF